MEDMHTLMLPDTELNSTTIKTTNKPRLLSIPGEIRNKIWRMLLTTKYAFKEPTSEGDREAHYELQPNILRVNRQIYHETLAIFREENMWIFICIALPKKPIHFIHQTARLPVVSKAELIESDEAKNCYLGMDSHALNICLEPEYCDCFFGLDLRVMIMGPESLPYLLQSLFPILYTHRSFPHTPIRRIEMCVGRSVYFTRSRPQREILEPFLAARGFHWVLTSDNIDRSFNYIMGHQFEDDTELLDFSDAYLKKGDVAAAAGLIKTASFYYEQGSDFTFYAGQSYLDTYKPQIEHVYVHIGIASMLTAFDINWAKTLLKLRCYADVQCLAASVLGRRRMSQSTSLEKVRLVLLCALASLGLEQTDRFREIMRDLFRGRCYLSVLSGSGLRHLQKIGKVFLGKRSGERKDAVIRELDDLVSYCKEGEEGSLRRIDTGGGLPDREEIEFPVAQDWSAIPARYEHRCETWSTNLSVAGLL